jgi:hypothetical protein
VIPRENLFNGEYELSGVSVWEFLKMEKWFTLLRLITLKLDIWEYG